MKHYCCLLMLALAACSKTVFDTSHMAANDAWQAEAAVPEQFQATPIEAAWWKNFGDPTLSGLVTQAATHNHDIRIALAVVDEARSLRRTAAADFYPNIGASAGVEREGLSNRGTSNNNTSEQERDNYDISLDASWELDIFGNTRRAVRAAEARIDASTANYHDVMLSIFAEIARTYFELRGTQKRLEIARHNIELLREVEKIAQARLESGAASEFDVTLARGEREAFEATLPNLEAEMAAGTYRLSVLTGKPPEYHLETLKAAAPMPLSPDKVPVGLKSDLLKRRPDVRRAESELKAAAADIDVAQAEWFPSVTLTGSLGGSARSFSELFTSGGFTYGFGAALLQPLFSGGRLRAAMDAADARGQQALAAYEQAVIMALEDAESSLMRYGKEWQTLAALQASEASRRQAYNIARLRYESGDEPFLTMLEAERALVTVQDEVIQSEARILTKLTQLYKALGGGWEVFAVQ